MKGLRKLFAALMSVMMVCTLIQFPLHVEAAADADTYIKELISYYKNYQDAASTDIERVLEKLNAVDPVQGDSWTRIMKFWSEVNQPGYVNEYTEEQLEQGLTLSSDIPNDNTVAVVILGYGLNSDGTMKDELVGRLKTGKAIADKLPNAYIVVTGGVEKNGWTEAARMSEWLLNEGVEDSRIIREDQAGDTVGNAKNTYKILVEQYPKVDSIVLVTGDYHVPRGSILYYSKFVLEAAANNSKEIKIISNGGYETGSNGYETYSLQASGVCSVAGVSSSSLPTVTLSVLETLKVTQPQAYVPGEELNLTVTAVYDTDFERDVTDLAVVTGFDPNGAATQTVQVSYTENGVTVSGNVQLSKSSVVLNAYGARIAEMLNEIEEMNLTTYTDATIEVLDYAVNNAETVLNNANATDEDYEAAYNALLNAKAGLEVRENVAKDKPVTASHNQTDAYKLTNGIKGDYWSGYENGANVPIENTSFVIDLEGVYSLDAVNVVPYYSTNNRYYHYDVLVSENGQDWTTIGQNRDTSITTEAGQVFETPETARRVRYIKVEGVDVHVDGRTDINNFHVTEVLAFGELLEAAEVPTETVPENLALYSKVTLNEGGTKPQVLVDGKVENSYSNSGAAITDSYAIVELPTGSTVNEVKVVTYYNNTSKWYTWEVLLSDDMSTWVSAGKYETEANPGSAGYTIELAEPTVAKYVKIQGLKTNNTNLHLVEIQVNGTFDNVAKGKSVSTPFGQSSAASMVDGVTSNSGYWSPGDFNWSTLEPANRPYAVIDLGSMYALDYVSVMAYVSSSRYYQYELHTSTDGVNYTEFGVKNDTVTADIRTDFNKSTPVNARYLKVIGTLNSANSGFHLTEVKAHGTLLPENDADYSAVTAAKNRIPSDLSLYTADSVVNVKLAVSAVKEGLKESQQNDVDEYADAINAAVDGLKYRPADYSEVEAAIASVPSDLTVYTEASVQAVNNVIASVAEGKKINEQDVVNGYAEAILTAIAALEYKLADYSEINTLLDTVPSDLSLYTEESVEALNNAMTAVSYDKNITEQDAVDAYAEAIELALENLAYRAADYTLVNDAIARIPSDLSMYTDATVAALDEAVNAVDLTKNITEQDVVDAYADAIDVAVAALEVKKVTDPSVVSKFDAQDLQIVPPQLSEIYPTVEELKAALISLVVGNKSISEDQTVVYDVTLLVSFDGGVTWVEADEENFPEDGRIKVILSYPGGTNRTYRFYAVHMFTKDAFGKVAGDVEYPEVKTTAEGIEFYVTGLSPIAISWEATILSQIIPNTSDSNAVMLWGAMLLVSAAALALLLKKRKLSR